MRSGAQAKGKPNWCLFVHAPAGLHDQADNLDGRTGKVRRMITAGAFGAVESLLVALMQARVQNGCARRWPSRRRPATGVVLSKLDGSAAAAVALAWHRKAVCRSALLAPRRHW